MYKGQPIKVPDFTPVHRDDLGDVIWTEPLQDAVGREEVLKAATTTAGPQYGERFAVLAIQYFTDARRDPLSTEDLEGILKLPDSMLGAYLVADQAGQVALHSTRHVDTSVEPWIRSGVDESRTKVRTQLNAYVNVQFDGEDTGLWGRFRADVEHGAGGWRVVSFTNAAGGHDQVIGEAESELFFYGGEGWRRLPAS